MSVQIQIKLAGSLDVFSGSSLDDSLGSLCIVLLGSSLNDFLADSLNNSPNSSLDEFFKWF